MINRRNFPDWWGDAEIAEYHHAVARISGEVEFVEPDCPIYRPFLYGLAAQSGIDLDDDNVAGERPANATLH